MRKPRTRFTSHSSMVLKYFWYEASDRGHLRVVPHRPFELKVIALRKNPERVVRVTAALELVELSEDRERRRLKLTKQARVIDGG